MTALAILVWAVPAQPFYPNEVADAHSVLDEFFPVDLNGDGITDFASGSSSQNVGVYIGDGDGTFQAPVVYPIGRGLRVLDLDGDGAVDFVATNSSSGTVSVRLGIPDGTLGPVATYPAGNAPDLVLAAHLNTDAHVDLAVYSVSHDQIVLLFGNGDGTFQDPTSNPDAFLPTGDDPSEVVANDLDLDGDLDLVLYSWSSDSMHVLLGNGDGTFQPPVHHATGDRPDDLVVADISGDGIPDVLVSGRTDDVVFIYRGVGDGSLHPPTALPTGQAPEFLEVLDLDGDSDPDVLTVNDDSRDVWVHLGNGDGTFQPPGVYAGAVILRNAKLMDVDGDSAVDVLISDSYGLNRSVKILRGNGDGTFQTRISIDVGPDPDDFTVFDTNGDGLLDLVSDTSGDFGYAVALNNGDGTYGGTIRSRGGSGIYGGGPVETGDFDGDDVLDVAVGTTTGRLHILTGNGDGSFGAGSTSFTVFVDGSVCDLTSADINGDGHLDVVTISDSTPWVSVVLGNGDGTFELPATYSIGITPVAILADHLDADAQLDLVVADAFGAVFVLRGLAAGGFMPAMGFVAGMSPSDVAAGDFDEDGGRDLVITNANFADQITILRGNGDGTFEPPVSHPVDLEPLTVVVADVNADTHDDIVIAHDFARGFSVLLGKGDGTFQPETEVYDGGWSDLEVADVDLDGMLDVVSVGRYVHVSLGNGDGTFQDRRRFLPFPAVGEIALADVDGDGMPDVVAPNPLSDYVGVLLPEPVTGLAWPFAIAMLAGLGRRRGARAPS
ncbi:MAG: VCBS repeat-containing protein [Deltaproteobacteria bacterium]|nr:VCBS repeat-containing protein [Deltaproteobacteria bacterium]